MANYLYNGVELPALPEWDRETYSVACTLYADGIVSANDGYRLYLCQKVYTTTSNLLYVVGPYQVYKLVDGEWVYNTSGGENSEQIFETVSSSTTVTDATDIWSDTDICYADGTLYLAASDPIPVETPTFTLHAASFLQGVEMGRRLRAQRGK